VDAEGTQCVCDFLISRSPEQLTVEAPAIVIVEAKKSDIKSGIGQCIAEMVAAQRFNAAKGKPVTSTYGSSLVEPMAVSKARGADGEH